MTNKQYLMLTGLAVLLLLTPVMSKASNNSSYSYRSTVIGTGIRDAGKSVYEISNQKSDFSKNESVYVLTRIFNITNVEKFQFKFQLLKKDGRVESELYSPLYQPRGNWWAETYAWHNFGKLDKNNYDIKVYININNEGYKYIDHKNIAVDGGYEYDNYNYYDNYYYYEENDSESYYRPINNSDAKYEYNWTYTGTDVEGYGYYKFKIINRQTEFEKNDNVFVLTKLANLKDVNEFKIKHELYLNGNDRSTSNESIVFRPGRKNWEYNYVWHNYGKLPNGQHTVKIYIKINNESYKQIGSVAIKVGKESDNFKYDFNWTKTDTTINNLGNGKYDVYNDRTSFNSDEGIKTLTKISNIRGADTFQVRHELKNNNGALYKRLDSGLQRPEYRVWDYYFYQSDFGKITAGDYKLETYIKFNDNSFIKINSRSINVNNKSVDDRWNRDKRYRRDCENIDNNDADDDNCRRGRYSDSRDNGYSWTRDDRTYQQPTRTVRNDY